MMKRLSLFLIAIFLCYIIYYDIKVGTLPVVSVTNIEASKQDEEIVQKTTIPYYEMKIKQGETVLSIIEKYHGGLPTSIEKIINDFETLNKNVKAESITVGKTYRFPDYSE